VFELKEGCFEILVILNRDRVHPEGSRHLCRITHGAFSAFPAPLLIPVGTFRLLGTIRKEKDVRFPHLPEGLQDRKEMVCGLGVNPRGRRSIFWMASSIDMIR